MTDFRYTQITRLLLDTPVDPTEEEMYHIASTLKDTIGQQILQDIISFYENPTDCTLTSISRHKAEDSLETIKTFLRDYFDNFMKILKNVIA